MKSVSFSEAYQFVKDMIQAEIDTFIAGRPGCGKSEMGEQIVKELGYRDWVIQPQYFQPGEFGGIPWIVEDETAVTPDAQPEGGLKAVSVTNPEGVTKTYHAQKIPFAEIEELFTATEPTVIRIEDVSHALGSVVTDLMQPLGARMLNGRVISPHIRFIMTGNRASDQANCRALPSTIISRCAMIDVEPSAYALHDYSVAMRWNPLASAFIGWKARKIELEGEDLDILFEEPSKTGPFATSRGYEKVSTMLNYYEKTGRETPEFAFATLMGDEIARDFIDFRDSWQFVEPHVAKVKSDPLYGQFPEKDCHTFALITAVASSVRVDEIENVLSYFDKLPQQEFAGVGQTMLEERGKGKKDDEGNIIDPDGHMIGSAPVFAQWCIKHKDRSLIDGERVGDIMCRK